MQLEDCISARVRVFGHILKPDGSNSVERLDYDYMDRIACYST